MVTGPLPAVQGIEGPEIFFESWKDLPEVQRYITYFRSPIGLSWLRQGMSRALPFRDFIVSALSQKSLPPELYFVVFVESTFDVDAVSRSGAAGLWQFMMNSIGTMKTSEWLDERFDFWTSTYAALDKLSYNYSILKDWPLALAAYNAGLGRIQQIMRINPGKTFWELSKLPDFPAETKEYVPRILAAAYVGSHPGRHGLNTQWRNIFAWDKIAISTSISLKDMEEKLGISDKLLFRGNAELRFELTPPGIRYLKVPRLFTDAVINLLYGSAIDPSINVYVARQGDTVYSLARKFGVSISMLRLSNSGLDNLPVGKVILIPLP